MERRFPCSLTAKDNQRRFGRPAAKAQRAVTRVQREILWERFWSERLEALKRHLEQDDDAQ